jgi:small conductance mechanosensitive channel
MDISNSRLTSILTSLTVSGIMGLAVSIRLQTTISNIMAGIFLLQDNALQPDDIITFGGVKGKVVKLGLRNTWLETEEGNIVIIGNSQLSADPLTNFTATTRLSKKLSEVT